MGAPRRNRKKYVKPKDMWSLERIKNDRDLIEQYGLRNMKELWKVQTEISRIRRNARELLAGSTQEEVKGRIIGRLARLGIVNPSATLDNLLDLKENSLLERRLQTMVYRKGLARSMKQARQLTTHGFIAINGRRVNKPGYLVDSEDEKRIGYYKPIDIAPPSKPEAEAAAEAGAGAPAGAQAAEAPQAEPGGAKAEAKPVAAGATQ